MPRWPTVAKARTRPQVMTDDEAELSAGALTDPCGPTVWRGRSRVVAFEPVSLGSGLIRFKGEDGLQWGAWAERERWGDYWPPREGDRIEVITRTTLVLRGRSRP